MPVIASATIPAISLAAMSMDLPVAVRLITWCFALSKAASSSDIHRGERTKVVPGHVTLGTCLKFTSDVPLVCVSFLRAGSSLDFLVLDESAYVTNGCQAPEYDLGAAVGASFLFCHRIRVCVAATLAECLVLWFCVSLLCDRHRPSSVHPYRVGVPGHRTRDSLAGSSSHTLAAGVCVPRGAGWAVSRHCPVLLAALRVLFVLLPSLVVLSVLKLCSAPSWRQRRYALCTRLNNRHCCLLRAVAVRSNSSRSVAGG